MIIFKLKLSLINPLLMKPLKIILIVCIFLKAFAAQGQVIKLPLNNGFRGDIQKVVDDYPHRFEKIKGAVLHKNPQSTEYISLLLPAGAEESLVVEYSATDKAIYSWQALMLTTESFEEASKKYKWLYHQLKGLNVTYVADQYTLRGNYDSPNEERKFFVSTLAPAAPPLALKKLQVDVSMNFEFPEWKVQLLIYEKEKEDEEGAWSGIN